MAAWKILMGVWKIPLTAAVMSLLLFPAGLAGQVISEVAFTDYDMALDLTEAKTFQKYPTYDQYLQMMQDYASDYPGICRLDTFGTTEEGRLLLALKISDHVQQDEAEAAFLYTSTMHGNEIVGFVLLLRLADVLLKGYGNDMEVTHLVDNLEIWINPLANPDGSYSIDDGLSLRHSFRHNIDGVDLNRDFPVPGKGEADDPTGRARETRSMMEFMHEHRFSMSANFHSGEEVVNYPWDNWEAPHVDEDWFVLVSREYVDEARAVDPAYMLTLTVDGIINGYSWYPAAGTRQEYIMYYLGGREVTIELSREMLLASDELETHWNLNHRSLINYLTQCTYGIRGTVTDLASGDPVQARVEVIGHDSDHDRSVVYSAADHGDFYRLIKEGSYTLKFTANGYFDEIFNPVSVSDFEATYLDVQMQTWPNRVAEHDAPDFRLYPNPSSGILFLQPLHLPPGKVVLSIHSMDGRALISRELFWHGEALELDIGSLEQGMYLVRISLDTRQMVHSLLVIDP
jgi:hypothetical protein